jgi:hypothetical protein
MTPSLSDASVACSAIPCWESISRTIVKTSDARQRNAHQTLQMSDAALARRTIRRSATPDMLHPAAIRVSRVKKAWLHIDRSIGMLMQTRARIAPS